MATTPQPDPLSLTTHYVGRPEPGPCEVVTTLTQGAKSHAFMEASLIQAGTVRARSVAVFGNRRDDQAYDVTGTTPASTPPGVGMPSREVPHGDFMPFMSFLERFRYLSPMAVDLFVGDGRHPLVGGWTSLMDRDMDVLAIPLFAGLLAAADVRAPRPGLGTDDRTDGPLPRHLNPAGSGASSRVVRLSAATSRKTARSGRSPVGSLR